MQFVDSFFKILITIEKKNQKSKIKKKKNKVKQFLVPIKH